VVKLKIDEHYLKLIDEVNVVEDKCMSKSTDLNRSVEDDVKTFEEKLESFRVELDKLEIDVDNWENVREGSNDQIIDLKKSF